MKDKQTKNDEKAKRFHFAVQAGLLEQQKLDEEKQLRAMREKMKQDEEREMNDRNAKIKVWFGRDVGYAGDKERVERPVG